MKRFWSAAGLVCAATVVALFLAELSARLLVRPADFLQVAMVADPVLGERIAPFATGHDGWGFRNASVPDGADVVAIGDSQTYGVSARREDSWPQQLGRLLGRQVYNMGLGGYGPIEYLYLVQHTAPKLHPKQIIVGFYFGNDLMDACVAVAQRAYWASWRTEPAGNCTEPPPPARDFAGVRDWLAKHVVLYGMGKAAMAPVITRLKDRASRREVPDEAMLWIDPANPSVHTIFTPQWRYAALDLDTPAVREGLRITKRAFAEIRDAGAAQGVPVLLVLIPTKEAVYCPYLTREGVALPPTFAALCDAEGRIKRELIAHLGRLGLRYVDVEPALQARVAERVPLYPTDDDGHPVAAGYAAIAKAVYGALSEQ